MGARVNVAVVATLLALSGCAKRVAPPSPGPAATDTSNAASPAGSPGSEADAPPASELAAKQALRTLFDLCTAKAHAKAAGYFLYNGSDEARRGKSGLSIDDPAEAEGVKTRCDNLASLIESSGGYAIIGYLAEKEAEGVWHRLQVSFSTPGQPTRRLFSVLEVDGAHFLGDVE